MAKSMPVEAMMAILKQHYAFGLPHMPKRDGNFIPIATADSRDGDDIISKSVRAQVDSAHMKRAAETLLAKSLDNFKTKGVDIGTRSTIERFCRNAINGSMPMTVAFANVKAFHDFSQS